MTREDSGMDALREVAELLYGAGADELISKLVTPEEKDRRQRAATAGLSAVGATAGTAGLVYAGNEAYKARKLGQKIPRGAKALLPLEVAGLGGELMATKILHGDAKKKKSVSKMEPSASDLSLNGAKKAGRKYALKKINQSPQVTNAKAEVASKVTNAKAGVTSKVKEKIGKSFTWEGEFSKVDADKRQVFGWASIVEMGGEPVYDLQGDYIEMDEIEKSAYDYVIKSRKGGDMHRRNEDNTPVHSSDMIESFMVTPEKVAKMGLPEGSLPTGWWVGFQVNDDDAWNLVKSGKRTAFSIHGRGSRTPMES